MLVLLRKPLLSSFQQIPSRVCTVKSYLQCSTYCHRSKTIYSSQELCKNSKHLKPATREVDALHIDIRCLSTRFRQKYENLTRFQFQQFVRNQAHTNLSTFALPKRIKKENVDESDLLIENNEDKVTELADLMNCDVELVRKLVRSDTRILTSLRTVKVRSLLSLLLENGFTAKDICTYPGVIMKSLATLELQLNEMQKVRRYKYKMRYLVLSQQQFYKYMAEFQKEVAIMGDHENRDRYIASLLDCTENDIVNYGEKHRFILTRPLTSLTRVVQLLKEHAFSSDDIKQRLKSLNINRHEAERRFHLIDEKNLLDKNHIAYLLSENKRSFSASLAAWQRDQDALAGHDSAMDYVQARLRCSHDDIEMMFTGLVALKHCHTSRFADILDLLLDEFEIPSSKIIAKPQLLMYSCTRLKSRYEQIREQGVTSTYQIIEDLCLSDTNYCEKYD